MATKETLSTRVARLEEGAVRHRITGLVPVKARLRPGDGQSDRASVGVVGAPWRDRNCPGSFSRTTGLPCPHIRLGRVCRYHRSAPIDAAGRRAAYRSDPLLDRKNVV